MDNRYCPECGNRLEKDSVFCPKCGFKLKDKEKKTKFCSHCGEKIDANAEICPKCGIRLINPLTNSASDVLNKGKTKADDFSKRYLTAKNFIIVILIIIIITLLVSAPSIIDYLTPYKLVDDSYIANPVPGEKVQFDGEYIGTTSWGGGYFLYYSYITDNDIVKVGDQYVLIQGDYLEHDLYGNEGKMVHLEGRFAGTDASKEPFGDEYIYGHWFGASTIEIID